MSNFEELKAAERKAWTLLAATPEHKAWAGMESAYREAEELFRPVKDAWYEAMRASGETPESKVYSSALHAFAEARAAAKAGT